MRILRNPNVNFIRWRWHAIILSVVVIAAGVATAISRGGLPLGVDFSGGTVVVVQFAQPNSEDAIRQALGPMSNAATVQRYGAVQDRSFLIRLPVTQGAEMEANLDEVARQVEATLRAANIGEFTTISSDSVGPTIGADLQRRGIWATLTAIGGILIYIGIRFRFAFAIGAVVATFHDILVVLAFLMWFGYDLTLNVVAAILTIAGYSVNDTIVVFDRVRENQRLARREPLEQVVNRAVNQTLARTIITAGTTFLAVMSLFVLGGEVLRGFAFTMLVGIAAGTYSTVFIAAAIAIVLSKRQPVAQGARAGADARRRA
jgi:preprotein translocase subunit SecF